MTLNIFLSVVFFARKEVVKQVVGDFTIPSAPCAMTVGNQASEQLVEEAQVVSKIYILCNIALHN